MVILGGFGEFAEDKVKLCAVVVDIGVVFVVCNSELEIVDGTVFVAYNVLAYSIKAQRNKLTQLEMQAGALDVTLGQ